MLGFWRFWAALIIDTSGEFSVLKNRPQSMDILSSRLWLWVSA